VPVMVIHAFLFLRVQQLKAFLLRQRLQLVLELSLGVLDWLARRCVAFPLPAEEVVRRIVAGHIGDKQPIDGDVVLVAQFLTVLSHPQLHLVRPGALFEEPLLQLG